MMYIFIGKEYDRGIPAKKVNEFAAVCRNETELYVRILKNPKLAEVYLIDRQMDEECILEDAKKWEQEVIADKERAEYERLKQKFEK